jgi:hypothetical protein
MTSTWIKYRNSENVTIIFNLQGATRFRHYDSGSESYIEVMANGEVHSVLLSTDPRAYQDVLDYIKRTTSYDLT